MAGAPARRSGANDSPLHAIEHLRDLFRVTILGTSPLSRYRAGPPLRHLTYPHAHVFVDDAAPRGEAGGGFAYVTGPIAPHEVFALVAGGCGVSNRLPIFLEVETAPDLDRALHVQGWHLDEEEPALVLTPVPQSVPQPPSELRIQRVEDPAALDTFHRLSPGAQKYVPTLAAATDPDVALILGYVGGVAVATSRLACVTGTFPSSGQTVSVADVNGVSTLREYRRRGYGTAMTWAAVAYAAARHCDAVALNASEMGYPVYLKMGFTPVATYRTYLPPNP